MRTLILFFILFLVFPAAADNPEAAKFVYGKIQIVDSTPDYRVQVVNSFPDLKVQKKNSFACRPGEWEIVDSFPDYRIQFVNSSPDFKIEWVNSFPGPTKN